MTAQTVERGVVSIKKTHAKRKHCHYYMQAFRETALDIVFASCAFWKTLDGFKSLLMRRVSRQIRDEVMAPANTLGEGLDETKQR